MTRTQPFIDSDTRASWWGRLGSCVLCGAMVLVAVACGGDDGAGAREAPPVGTVATSVVHPAPASVSPDGRWLGYLEGADTVCVLELVVDAEPACGTSELLGGDSLVWSEDSERLVTGFDLPRLRPTRPIVVDRAGMLAARGGEAGRDEAIFQGSSALVGEDVLYVRFVIGSDMAEVVLDTAGGERILAEVPTTDVSAWPVVIDGDRALFALGRGSEARVGSLDLAGGDLTEVPGLEGLVIVETDGATALAVDEEALTIGLDEPVFLIADLGGTVDEGEGDDAPVAVVREALRARAAALSSDGERLAVVWVDPAEPLDGAVLAVASVDSVRAGDADWTDTSIEGPGPFTDRHRRMRWTSDSTVTMVLDGAVVTIDVGTE